MLSYIQQIGAEPESLGILEAKNWIHNEHESLGAKNDRTKKCVQIIRGESEGGRQCNIDDRTG